MKDQTNIEYSKARNFSSKNNLKYDLKNEKKER
jgi:hypothetical protein